MHEGHQFQSQGIVQPVPSNGIRRPLSLRGQVAADELSVCDTGSGTRLEDDPPPLLGAESLSRVDRRFADRFTESVKGIRFEYAAPSDRARLALTRWGRGVPRR